MKVIYIKSEFIKNVFTLMSGITVAQVIPLFLMPVLSRLYSPEDFGLLALFTSISSILFTLVCFRYDMAIMLPKNGHKSIQVVSLCISIAFIFSISIFILVCFFSDSITSLLGNKNIKPWLYALPFSVFMLGMVRVLTLWFNRQKNYKTMTYAKVLQHGGSTGAQVLSNSLWGGLIFGYIFGILSSFFLLFKKFLKSGIQLNFNRDRMLSVAKEYKDLPKYSLFGALANNTAAQVPTLIITKYFSESILGSYNLAYRIVTAPLLLLTTALSQVVFQKITNLSHVSPKDIYSFVLKGTLGLFILFFPLIPIMYFFGDIIFSIAFGDKWKLAGNYAVYLSFSAVFQLSVSPFSTVLLIGNNVRIGMLWQVFYFTSITITLLLASSSNIDMFLIVLVSHNILLYLLYFFLILLGSKRLVNINNTTIKK